MNQIKLLLLTLCTSLVFTACSKKESPDEIKVQGYLEIEAVCTESIRSEKNFFTGYLVDIYNATQNTGFIHGTVTYQKTLTQTNSDYVAPSKVTFSKITAEEFGQSAMILSGLSHRSTNRDVYKSTCDIKVLKRLKDAPK